MTIIAIVGVLILAWCVLPIPLAVAVGRAFRAGEMVEPSADHEAAGAWSSMPTLRT
ncbi:hypothetical protein ABLE68_11075 [Nocardioides sp. CN2-186]|uniref:hypothetical protein n=1 Tax=Nocardioides tweenelious TaxID=3156607 RepID=UPI0032B5EC1E